MCYRWWQCTSGTWMVIGYQCIFMVICVVHGHGEMLVQYIGWPLIVLCDSLTEFGAAQTLTADKDGVPIKPNRKVSVTAPHQSKIVVTPNIDILYLSPTGADSSDGGACRLCGD